MVLEMRDGDKSKLRDKGNPEGRGQHHRYRRTQVAGHGRLGIARNRQVAGRDS